MPWSQAQCPASAVRLLYNAPMRAPRSSEPSRLAAVRRALSQPTSAIQPRFDAWPKRLPTLTSSSTTLGARPRPGSKMRQVEAEPLPDSGQGTVVHCDGSAVKGRNGRGPEASDDQINAQRKFPYCDRDCEQPCRRGMLPDETEQHGDVASDQKRRAGESEQRKNAGHQARLVQQRAK